MLNRRMLLAGAAVVPLAGCTTAQITSAQQAWTNFIDEVNAVLAAGCGALPGFAATATTIESVVEAFFPSISAAITAGALAVQAVTNALCSTVPVAPPAALAGKLRANTSRGIKTIIGTVTINGKPITVTGYAPH